MSEEEFDWAIVEVVKVEEEAQAAGAGEEEA